MGLKDILEKNPGIKSPDMGPKRRILSKELDNLGEVVINLASVTDVSLKTYDFGDKAVIRYLYTINGESWIIPLSVHRDFEHILKRWGEGKVMVTKRGTGKATKYVVGTAPTTAQETKVLEVEDNATSS